MPMWIKTILKSCSEEREHEHLQFHDHARQLEAQEQLLNGP